MKRISAFLVCFVSLIAAFTTKVEAIYDPLSVSNNRFGIHIVNERDLDGAASLINSSGGDWGYVTVVITEAERDHDRWQKVFDTMRRKHLIPIVRVATKAVGDIWEKPKPEEINNWVGFLNSLNWVIKNRYVIISNEPNHAKEWGGQVDPVGYAEYLDSFSSRLKSASEDFYILPAGLDASATNSKETMEESRFLKEMLNAKPDVFNFIDGWTSHSYPNPDFSGSETAEGKGTLKTFDWELTFLLKNGVDKNLPVFITETGWSNQRISDDEISRRLDYAFKYVWGDDRIIAVTPFILNYNEAPFSQFSWEDADRRPKKFYLSVKDIDKVKGAPFQINKGEILFSFVQPIIPLGSDFYGMILAKNSGQSIWTFNDIAIGSQYGKPYIKSYSFNDLEPPGIGVVIFKAESPETTGLYASSLFLKDAKGEKITNSYSIEGLVAKVDQSQIKTFFDKIGSYFQSALFIPKF